MNRSVGRNEMVGAYLYVRPIRYVSPEERKFKESQLALVCVRTHHAGCRCWKELKE